MTIHEHRRDYNRFSLSEKDLDADPIRQFEKSFEEASLSDVVEPNAMSLATATPEGYPSVRIVLLRGVDDRGFASFTNYNSRKGREPPRTPAALAFFSGKAWNRQVRIEGRVERVDDDESDRYFQGRPLASRIGAWASPQSEVIADPGARGPLSRRAGRPFRRRRGPPAGQLGRLPGRPRVDRVLAGRTGPAARPLRYTRQPGDGWLVERLAP